MASDKTMQMRGLAPTPRVAKSMPPSLRRQYRGQRRQPTAFLRAKGIPPWKRR